MADKNNTPVNIQIEKLYPFEGHPYKIQDNEEMNALIESIQENGVLSPVIVRPKETTADEYEIVSGHRRVRAATKAGMKEIPALIIPLDRDAAAIVVVDSNLHRENISPSEKAFAYKLKMDALSKQGKRTDLTSDQVGRKLETAEIIGIDKNESKNQVRRYIRLTHLIPQLLDMVDEGRIAFTPAVELSYLDELEQFDLAEEISLRDATPNLSQAQRLRAISAKDGLTCESINRIMSEEKANQIERVRIPVDKLRKYFPSGYTTAQMEDEIVKMCEARFQKRLRNRESR